MVISYENILKINQRLEVMLSKNTNAPRYTSRIEEMIPNHMIIAMPMDKGYPVLLERERVFYGKIFDTSGVYIFTSTFVGKKMSPLPIWIVTMPFDIQKSQQRSFVRFEIKLPVTIQYVIDDEESKVVSLDLTTKDLSGGGLQVISQKKLDVGKKLRVLFKFPDHGMLELDGEVVRIHQPQSTQKIYWIGIKFLDISENIRDKISKFIFRKQLEQRQKRW